MHGTRTPTHRASTSRDYSRRLSRELVNTAHLSEFLFGGGLICLAVWILGPTLPLADTQTIWAPTSTRACQSSTPRQCATISCLQCARREYCVVGHQNTAHPQYQ